MFPIIFLLLLETGNSQINHLQIQTEEFKMAYITIDPPYDVGKYQPPIIMLHGMTDNKESWLNVAAPIVKKTGRKIYMLDARNHGDSSWSDDFDFDILANDVDHFMTEHNIPKAVIVGHSMGARTAMILALKKPHRVEMAVLEDMSTADVSPEVTKATLELIEGVRILIKMIPSSADETAARKLIFEFFNKSLGSIAKKEELLDLSNRISIKKQNDRWAWKANFDALEIFLKSGKLNPRHEGQYVGPALFIYGLEAVNAVGDTADDIRRYFPKAELVGVQTGHLIHNTRPNIFFDVVSKFINAHKH